MWHLQYFYNLSIVGLFSLILFDIQSVKLFSPTLIIFMFAAMFAGLYFKTKAQSAGARVEAVLCQSSPILFPLSLVLLKTIAM